MIDRMHLKDWLNAVRCNTPVIHNITNYVVMNITSNALLALGAKPLIAHAIEEVEEMVDYASALVINLGTVSQKWSDAMLLAGKSAQKKGIPLVFDPSGVYFSSYRNNIAATIINTCHPAIIRGNESEIIALANNKDIVNDKDNYSDGIKAAKQLALKTGSIVIISGKVDFVTDGKTLYKIMNGSKMMPLVTGIGCISTAIVAAYAAMDDNYLRAAVVAMITVSIAGERAAEKSNGPGSMQINFIDTLYNIDSYILQEFAAYELIEE